MLKNVCEAIKPALAHRPLIISVAAGITTDSLARWVGEDLAIIRAMPKTPSQSGLGATGLFANRLASASDKAMADDILGAVGKGQRLADGSLINTVTAGTGPGPG